MANRNTQQDLNKLVKTFCELENKANRNAAVRSWASDAATGPSVIRTLGKGTRIKARDYLENMPLSQLKLVRSREQYDNWFFQSLGGLSIRIARLKRIHKTDAGTNFKDFRGGLKWGHAAKILNIYLKFIVANSHYFSNKERATLVPFLYAPVDTIVIGKLGDLGVQVPWHGGRGRKPKVVCAIKDINTRKLFEEFQEVLGQAADLAGAPRIRFDDVLAHN